MKMKKKKQNLFLLSLSLFAVLATASSCSR